MYLPVHAVSFNVLNQYVPPFETSLAEGLGDCKSMLPMMRAVGKSSMAVVEPGREEAKAQLQEALERVAAACCSSASDRDQSAFHPDLQLTVSFLVAKRPCLRQVQTASRPSHMPLLVKS